MQMLLPAQTDIADFNICLEKIVCRQYRINRYIADRAGTGEMLINLIVLLVHALPADFPAVFYIFVILIFVLKGNLLLCCQVLLIHMTLYNIQCK